MGRVRVQWRGVGKVAVAAVLGLAALQVLPGLLRPPQAPPLAADVGLPRVSGGEREIAIREADAKPRPRRPPHPRRADGVSAATAVIGTTPQEPRPKRSRRKGRVEFVRPLRTKSIRPSASTPAPAPEAPPYVPPPAPPPAPEFVPAQAPEPPPPPGDGSVEFAPR
jgi:hypothetical protein